MENKPKTAGNAADHELSPEVIRKIESAWAVFELVDFYSLLGVGRDAPVRKVRSAFLAAAAPYHPDRYFGKKLGAYKEKIIAIFSRMSLAHDTLVSDEKRAAYDATLPPEEPRDGAPVSDGMPTSQRMMPMSERVPVVTTPAPPPRMTPYPASQTSMKAPSSKPPTHDSGARPAVVVAEAERARAAAFALRMGRSMGRKLTPSSGLKQPTPYPGTQQQVDSKAAAESLRRRYEESKKRVKDTQAAALVKTADAALAKGDLLGAARGYREAANTSGDGLLKAKADELESQAKEKMHELALHRGKECEAQQAWAEAGNQFAKVFELKPSAEIAYRAANALRRDGGDLRRAAKFAEEAVKLQPGKAAYHLVLGLCYMDAGLVLRARGEIDRAKELDPNSAGVKEALARLKSMK